MHRLRQANVSGVVCGCECGESCGGAAAVRGAVSLVAATVRGAVGGVMTGNYYHRFEHLAPYITLATDGTGEGEKHPGRGWSAPAVRVGGCWCALEVRASGDRQRGNKRQQGQGRRQREDSNEG